MRRGGGHRPIIIVIIQFSIQSNLIESDQFELDLRCKEIKSRQIILIESIGIK